MPIYDARFVRGTTVKYLSLKNFTHSVAGSAEVDYTAGRCKHHNYGEKGHDRQRNSHEHCRTRYC